MLEAHPLRHGLSLKLSAARLKLCIPEQRRIYIKYTGSKHNPWDDLITDRQLQPSMLRWRFSFETGESSMRPEATVAFQDRITANKTDAKDTWAILLLVPLAMCLFSILLAVESPAFGSAMRLMALE